MWVVPLGFAVVTRTHVYNGWRHFYFLYGPMLVLAAWGAANLWKKRAFAILMAACLALSGVGIATQHPYQYAYYQPLVQLRGTDYNELDYWNISARDALEELAAQTEGDITIAPADLWSEDALAKALRVLDAQTAARFTVCEGAQFILSNATYANLSGFDPAGMKERVVLTAYGQPIMRIYEASKEAETP